MKLYYTSGTCALASHIVANEAALGVTPVMVDLRAKKLPGGGDYLKVNPKGYVPALELDNGEVVTEGVAILQYLADQKPAAKLIPAAGTMDRVRMNEWLTFISTEVHKSYSPLFDKTIDTAMRDKFIEKLNKRYGFIEETLTKHSYLTGEQFTVADAYLFTVTRWATPLKIDLSAFKGLTAFMERVGARQAVKDALADEGTKN